MRSGWKRRRTTKMRLIASAVALLVLAAACGGDGVDLEALDDGAAPVDLEELGGAEDVRGVSFRDGTFDSDDSPSPTAEKPQSKLWYHAGTWWGVVANAAGDVTVHRLSEDGASFADTGTLVDERAFVRADVLAVDDVVYVVTGGKRTYRGHAMQLSRIRYSPATDAYVMDPGFPAQITEEGGGNGVLARDSTGRIWLSLVRDGMVTVAYTTGDDRSWTRPAVPQIEGAPPVAVEAALVAYHGQVGLLWADEASGAFYFAVHLDQDPPTTWQPASTVFEGLPADDHLNLKADRDGVLYAVVKTAPGGVTTSRLAPQVVLLVRAPGQQEWNQLAVSQVKDKYTRPLLLLDEEQRLIYVIAASPNGGGTIYYKRSSLDHLSFSTGLGTPLVHTELDPELNNPTSTKQSVTPGSGIVVLASDDSTGRYVHGVLGFDSEAVEQRRAEQQAEQQAVQRDG